MHSIILQETEQHKRSLLKFQWLRTTLQYLQPEIVKTPSFFDSTLPNHRMAQAPDKNYIFYQKSISIIIGMAGFC